MTRRFLPTWRPGQVGGDGSKSAAVAGANPHSSRSSPALAGPLSRRRRLLSSRRRLAAPGSLAAAGPKGQVKGRPGSDPRAERSGGATGAALEGRPFRAAKTSTPLSRTAAGPARPPLPDSSAALHASSPPPPPPVLSLFSSSSPTPAAGSRGSDEPPPPLRPCMKGRRRRTCF